MERICPCCNREFITNNNRKIFCTRICTIRNQKRKHDIRKRREKDKEEYFLAKEDLTKDIIQRVLLKQGKTIRNKEDFNYKYNLFTKKDIRGWTRYFLISIQGEEFKLDKKGLIFFKDYFDDESVFVKEGYLAKRINDKIRFFHREFKLGTTYAGKEIHVHHKNFRKWDNRLCNLEIMSKEKHFELHEEIRKDKYEKEKIKAEEKYRKQGEKWAKQRAKREERYRKKGERMQQKYEERGERIRERYRKRGERMVERYRKKWR